MKFVGHCGELGRAGEGRTVSALGSGENALPGNSQQGYCPGCRSLIREKKREMHGERKSRFETRRRLHREATKGQMAQGFSWLRFIAKMSYKQFGRAKINQSINPTKGEFAFI